MPLYEVTVERTEQATLWIEADDKAQAHLDADELGDALTEFDWEFFGGDISIAPRAELPAWVDVVWVGGEDGAWLPRSAYVPKAQSAGDR